MLCVALLTGSSWCCCWWCWRFSHINKCRLYYVFLLYALCILFNIVCVFVVGIFLYFILICNLMLFGILDIVLIAFHSTSVCVEPAKYLCYFDISTNGDSIKAYKNKLITICSPTNPIQSDNHWYLIPELNNIFQPLKLFVTCGSDNLFLYL